MRGVQLPGRGRLRDRAASRFSGRASLRYVARASAVPARQSHAGQAFPTTRWRMPWRWRQSRQRSAVKAPSRTSKRKPAGASRDASDVGPSTSALHAAPPTGVRACTRARWGRAAGDLNGLSEREASPTAAHIDAIAIRSAILALASFLQVTGSDVSRGVASSMPMRERNSLGDRLGALYLVVTRINRSSEICGNSRVNHEMETA